MASLHTPTLVELAQKIVDSAKALQDGLAKSNLPQPTFDAHGSRADYHDIPGDDTTVTARSDLIEASRDMLTLARGPTEALRAIVTTDRTNLFVTGALHELKVASAVPKTGSISLTDLANNLAVHETLLHRLLCYAYTMHMFHEPQPNHIAHTALSLQLEHFAPYLWLQFYPTIHAAMLQVASSIRLNPADLDKPGVPLTLADDPQHRIMWDMLKQEPEGMKKFSLSIRTYAQFSVGPEYRQYLSLFPWSSLGHGPIIDVGGGNGHIACAIASVFPEVEIIVHDLPSVSDAFHAYVPPELKKRVTFQEQDFFTPQPPDLVPAAYLVSRVLHDWSDADSIRILKPLVPAMERGAKLVIVDRILPSATGELPKHQEALQRNSDLQMFLLLGGKERSFVEWEDVLRRTDGRLRVLRRETPVGAELGVLEVGLS